MPSTRSKPCRAVLFDLGNVVIEVDFRRVLATWQPASTLSPQALAQAFAFDAPYERHETGALDANGYFAHLRQRLGLRCDNDAMRQGWNAVFVRPIEETLAMIHAISPQVPCHALSNTNAVHVAEMQRAYPQVLSCFRHVFASNEIGYRKPQPQAFRHVLDAIGSTADEVLFFDDAQENVDAARACGIEAVLVRSPHDVRQALTAAGLLPAP